MLDEALRGRMFVRFFTYQATGLGLTGTPGARCDRRSGQRILLKKNLSCRRSADLPRRQGAAEQLAIRAVRSVGFVLPRNRKLVEGGELHLRGESARVVREVPDEENLCSF